MPVNIAKEVAALERMTVRELRLRYAEVFNEETKAGNKAWLIKRIAWRLQSLEEGDISERARQRAAELAIWPSGHLASGQWVVILDYPPHPERPQYYQWW
jgi:hypothetical protein